MPRIYIFLEFFVFFFFVISVLIYLVDATKNFYTWQSRIKIGKFSDQEEWKTKMLETSRKWLKNTPTIKLTDNNRLIIIDIIKGNYKRKAIQSWQEAALLLGLNAFSEKNKNQKIRKEIKDFVAKKIDSSGNWKTKPIEVDFAILAYAIMMSDQENIQKNKPAFDEVFHLIKSLIGEDGTVGYRKHTANYRFVDTVGFVAPFLMSYGQNYSNEEAIKLSIKQIMEYRKFGFQENIGLPCHTYQVSTKIPVGLFGWGRGLAWYIFGLIETWKILPQNHPEKLTLKEIMLEMVQKVIPFQEKNGGFHWLLMDKNANIDSSVTSVLAWFFGECEEFLEISQISKDAKMLALRYLQSVTRRNGAIDFSQGDTKAIGIYSQNFDILPFTQGFCLRAAI